MSASVILGEITRHFGMEDMGGNGRFKCSHVADGTSVETRVFFALLRSGKKFQLTEKVSITIGSK